MQAKIVHWEIVCHGGNKGACHSTRPGDPTEICTGLDGDALTTILISMQPRH